MEYAPDEAGPRKVFNRASIVAAGTAYQQGISFVSGLVVARVLGAADYGIFNLARNLIDVTGIVARLGLDIGLQRYFGETNSPANRASRVVLLRRVRLLAGTFAMLPVVAVALGVGLLLEQHVYRFAGFADILLCLALALPFVTDIAVLGGAYRGILRLSPSVLAESVLLPTFRIATIIVLFLAGWRLWAVVVGTTLGSMLASLFLALRARADFSAVVPDGHRPWTDAFHVVRYSTVLAVAVLVTTLTSSVDMLLLGYFTSAQDVGQYSLVKMLLLLMGMFGVAFGQGLGTLVAERHARRDYAGMVQVMSLTARWIALGTLPVFAVFLFWGAELTLLFGASFGTSQAVVCWLATSQLVFSVFGLAGWALSMTGRHVREVKILCAGLLIAVALGWMMIPLFGQLGAAVATCTSVTIANLLRVLFVRRAIGRFPVGGDLIGIVVVGIGLAWASSVLVSQLGLSALWSTVCGIGCFSFAYLLVGWIHLLNESEKDAIRRSLRRTRQRVFSGA